MTEQEARLAKELGWKGSAECRLKEYKLWPITGEATLWAALLAKDAELERVREAANVLIDYCIDHDWGMMPEPFDSINPLLKLLGRSELLVSAKPGEKV